MRYLLAIVFLSLLLVGCGGGSSNSGSATLDSNTPDSDATTTSSCCKVCSTGKACGDSCISKSYTCSVGAGCACNSSSTLSVVSGVVGDSSSGNTSYYDESTGEIIFPSVKESESSNDQNIPVVMVGNISDLEGLGYLSGIESGIVDENGFFSYQKGSDIEFYIGDNLIGVMKDGVVGSFIGMFDEDNNYNWVVFALSIDTDGDPYTGIQITPEMHDIAKGIEMDFTQSRADFRNDVIVQGYISNISNTSSLVSDEYYSMVVNSIVNN